MANLSDGTIFIQGEALDIISSSDPDRSLARTQTANQEKRGLNGQGDPNLPGTNVTNPGAPQFDAYGLRPDYTGDGYLDLNGKTVAGEAKLAFSFEAEPGTYEVTLRLANGATGTSVGSTRPILLRTDAGDTDAQATQTSQGGSVPQWFLWELRTFTIEVTGEPGVSKAHQVQIVTTTANGPNIDAIAIAEVGTPVSFVRPAIETTALSMLENGVDAGQVFGTDLDGQALTFGISGGADAALFDISADGSLTFKVAPDFEARGSAAGTNAYEVLVSATDGADTATQTVIVSVGNVSDQVQPQIDQIVLSGEAGTIAGNDTIHRQQSTADDPENPTNEGAPDSGTGSDKPLDAFGLRVGYSGEGYTDFGSTPGDTVSWTVTVDVAGAYDLHVRYAASSAQPLDLVAGETAIRREFAPVNGSGLKDWVTVTIPVVLTDGANTVSLAIPAGFASGPNIDAIAVTSAGGAADFFAPAFDAQIGAVAVVEGAELALDLSATDASETPDAVSYALSGDDAVAFTIDDAGTLTFGAADFEAPTDADRDNVYDVTVEATAGGTTVRQSLTVSVTDLDETAPVLVLTGRDVAENVAGAVVADIALLDSDSVYAASDFAVGGDDAALFEVTGAADSGFVLRLVDGVALDFEAVQPIVTVLVGGVAAAPFTPSVTNDPTDDDSTGDNAPVSIAVIPVAFDENVAEAAVAEIAVTGGAAPFGVGDITLSGVEAGRFSIRAGAAENAFRVVLTDALDFEAGAFPSVTVEVGGASAAVSAAPTDVNEAPSLAPGAMLGDVEAVSGTESVLSLTGLGATDEDGDVVTWGLRATDGNTLPAGISIRDAELVVAADAAPGTYAVEVFATDGALDSKSVPLTVTVTGTVGEPAAFVPFALQGEAAVITLAQAFDTNSTIHRDANVAGEAELKSPNDGKILEGGVRAGHTGLGYIDFGNDAGDKATFTFEVPVAGTYDLNIRYASQVDSRGATRVLDLAANGGTAVTTTFPSTGPGSGPAAAQGFNTWGFLTIPVTLVAGTNTVSLAMAAGTTAGPNVDRIEITAAGSGPIPATDLTADEGDDLVAATDAVARAQDLDAVEIVLDGVDADIATIEASVAGGAFVAVTATGTGAARIVTLDLSAFAEADSVAVELRLTDDAGNVVTRTVAIEVDAAPSAADGAAATTAGQAVTIDLAGLIADVEADAEGGQLSIVSATSDAGTVVIDDVLKTLTFTPAAGTSGPAAIAYVIEDSVGQRASAQIEVTVSAGTLPAIALVAVDFAENEPGAVVADIVVTDATPAAGEIDLGGNAAYRVIGEPGALRLALAEGMAADAEGAALVAVSVSFGGISSEALSPVARDVDDPATITLTPLAFQENVAGAAVAAISVTDQDAGDAYAASDFTVSGDALDRFEVALQDGGLVLRLKAGVSLDAEAAQPTLTVGVGGGTAVIAPAPGDVAEPRAIAFDGAITAYNDQDLPRQGGSVTADEGSITLDGNLWKRVAIEPVTLTETSVLRVTIATPVVGEIVAVGFDADGDAFDADRNLFQLAGTQRFSPFVDLSGTGRANGDGTTTFEIPLAGQAGQTFGTIVVINDDDNFGNGRGRVTFSNVEIVEQVSPTGNQAPRVVGGGVADLSVNERGSVEVDLPFVDDDGDALTFAVTATIDGAAAALPLTITDGTLAGDLGTTAPGIYTITVEADDGRGGVTSDTFTLEVVNVNEAPVADLGAAFEPFFGAVGTAIAPIDLAQFAGAFVDPDGDVLEIVVTGLPAGLRVEEGMIFGTPTSAGDGTFRVAARDPDGALSAGIEISLAIDAPGIGDVISVEAEAFTGLAAAQGFFATGQAGASGDRLIRTNANQDGAITTQLGVNGVAEGWYTIQIDVFDETDGAAAFALSIDGTAITAPVATFDDAGQFLNPGAARGGAGQAGNLKRIAYDVPVFVSDSSVLTLTGRADAELLRTDRVIFTRVEAPNLAPEAPVLAGDPVTENVEGAAAGILSAVDPDGDDSAVTFSVDPASIFEVVGTTLKLKAGQALDFEAGAFVEVVVTATDAGGRATTATLQVAVADVDEATGAPVLTADAVAENAAGATIGQLSAVGLDGGAVTFTVTDPRFTVDAAGVLSLADGVALNFEEGETVTVAVTASDGVTATTGDVTVTVSDANDAPALAEGATLDDLSVAFGVEGRVDLGTALAATDEDGDVVSYGLRGADGASLPAGISIDGTTLVVALGTDAGSYALEIFATDGSLESNFVPLGVTVGTTAPFTPFAVQAETGTVTLARPRDTQSTQVRDADNPETGGTTVLRPDFSGTGYVDYGNDGGDALTLTVTVPTAGLYDLNVRYASNTARPLDLAVNGVTAAAPMAFASTDPDAAGPREGFDSWAFETRTVSLTAGQNAIAFLIPAGATTGPNLDRIEITAAGTGPIPAADTSADADAFPLELGGIAEGSVLNATQAASLNFNVTGDDADVVRVEISFDGGTTRTDVTAIVDADGDFVFDGSGLPAGANTATIIVTDAAGNEAFDDLAFRIDRGVAGRDPIVIQAEDETRATITDVGVPNSAGPGGASTNDTREVNASAPDGFGNYRAGAIGEAYVDFGNEAGDAITFSVDAPVAGTYSVAIRYANGSDTVRPLEVAVNGGSASNVAFASTGTGEAGWENWTEITIELDLVAGTNAVSQAIPSAVNGGFAGGPNIDQITFTPPADDTGGPVEPDAAQRFEDVIRINFEAPTSGNGTFNAPAGYVTPAGFASDTGAAFGDRGNGHSYGWVDVENGAVTATPNAQPTGSARYKDDVPGASDLQKTYLHFEYPGADAADRERAWEIEVENGTYELTLSIGDTAGKYDSDYVVNVEGQRFGNPFTPVALDGVAYGNAGAPAYSASFDGQGFRSSLQTAIVQVTDGRLTIDSIGGANTEIQYLDLQRVPDLTPGDGRSADLDYSKFVAAVAASNEHGQVSIEIDDAGKVPLGIDPTSSLVVGVELQAIDHRGPAITSVDGVRLFETLTGIEVAVNVQITGGADGMAIKPLLELKEFTSYTLKIENVLDLGDLTDSTQPHRQFQDYTTTFVTGEAPEDVAREVAFTDQVVLDGFAQGGVAFTSIEFGPDGKLYTSSIGGVINRWDVNSDGTIDVSSNEVLDLGYFTDGGRSIIGLAFDPEDPNVIWVTDNAPVPREGKADQTPDFSGQISKVTLGAGGAFEGAVAQAYVTGLPRSGGDHVTNSLEFRANPDAGQAGEPNFLLYLTQGSNSAAGRPDNAWGFRPERLLSAAVLEVDPSKDAPHGGFDVQTEPYDPAANAPTFRSSGTFNADGTFAGFYDPFAEDAVLRIYGEGIRNGYDLVWHSNGNLYVAANGTARGGNTLDDPNTAISEVVSGLDKQYDYLFQVQEGGYYGHPNSLLGHYVVNGGAEGPNNVYGANNSANTPDGGKQYASGVVADAEYDRDGAYSLDFNKSPNGSIEYSGNAFGSNLNGALLIAQFSVGDNVRVINVDPVTGRVTGDDVLRRPGGDVIDDYIDPLDIIENPLTGQLYLMTLNRGTGESKIILLTPAPGGVTADVTADAGGDLALTVIDSGTSGAVLFAVTGLDDDIETIQVAFDGDAAQTVTLDAQGRFTFDLTGRTGPVTGVLTVRDEVPNTATATTSFTLGDPGEPVDSLFLDATAFRVLSTLTGTAATIIRRTDDPTTKETTGSNDGNGDGYNDGFDGIAYLDPNGAAEDKAAFDVTVDAPGNYTFVFRMAATNDRSIAVRTGDQSEAITVNTASFTNWIDYPVVLTLEAGLNTIVIAQTSAAGPNIDSVTVTPLDVAAPDTTADEGGDLALALVDATTPSAAIFEVTGDDDDIASYAISFDGGATRQVVTPDAAGRFTVDISALSGAVTAVLTVTDAVPNTASASATVDAGGETGDGTVVIDGVTYVLYEAETAALDGASIVGDDVAEDGRGAQGGAFVDFTGTADQTILWTVEVAQDGEYGIDILYALGVPKAPRPLALSVDGAAAGILPFESNSNADETLWAPQSTTLTLTAGTHTIAVTAPGGNGPNIDQLRITQAPLSAVADTTADAGGDLAVALSDASDRAATVFTVTGLDDDIETLSVSFDGGATSQPVTLSGGTFTADTSALAGEVTVTLTVRDEVPNTASATTAITLGAVVADDGTAVIDGVTYVLYEAETAALDGAAILGDDAGEDGRGAQGGAFVDFTGTTDQTIAWTVRVDQDGAYGVDILYALGAGKAARPMTIEVDGTAVETLPFAANSNAGETLWAPQSTVLDLTAGIHTITVRAPGANGPNVDQLRITQAPVEPVDPGDPDADIEIASLDPAFLSNRLHFNWLDNNGSSNPDRDYKENAFIEISNSGTKPLEFRSATLTGPFDLADETVFDGLVLAAGAKITVEVLFDRSEYTARPSSVTGVFEGALTLRTNDADTPVATVDLAGFWQSRDEGGQEPNINEVWNIFGFGNVIEGLSLNGGGENSVLDFWDIYLPVDETEVLSPYWRIADGVTQARITQIAAFHGDGGATLGIHAPGNKDQHVIFSNHGGDQNQSILPLKANGEFATATFTNATIPNGWTGNDVFGIEMVNLSTDPTLNPTGSGAPTQSALNARYPGYTVVNGVVFDPQGVEVPDGYTVRMFQAVDKDGMAIANTFLGVMDYTGINYDYNDNMFVIQGVQAIGNGATFAIAGLDDAAADDRLVFTGIDNPANVSQMFRDTATFTISNDGIAPLKIQSLGVTGDFTITGLATGQSIAAGASANVTVKFTGTDGVNDNAAVLLEGALTIGTNVGAKTVALAGLAQFESENGEEPSVAQIVEALGYGTDVAQGQLANGGRVETIGDEVLMPYMERLDGSRPVEVIQVAAFLNQGNVARLSAHGLESSALTQLFAADDNQGQTVLPDGLVQGLGNTGGVARAVIDDNAPFGLKVTVDGRPTYASWTDPEANRIDPDFGRLVADDRGHLIRFFQAKDAAGQVIEGTFIAIQDYPGAGNYDYNDHMFVIKNVRPHALTAAEDADRDGVLDVLRTDADGDGTVAFFDADETPDTPDPTLAKGGYVVGFNVGGPAVAAQAGLGGVALRGDGDPLIAYAGDGATRAPGFDLASNPNGANALPGAFKSYRDGKSWSATVNGLTDGEYVVVLHTQETYHATAGRRQFDLSIDGVKVADDLDPFKVAGGDTRVSVEALVQVTGGRFTVTLDSLGSDGIDNAALNAITIYQSAGNPGGGLATANSAPTTAGITGVPGAIEGQAFAFDISRFFADADAEDELTFTANLPAGLSISSAGIITGMPTVDGTYAVTVTASDGQASVSAGFSLSVADTPAPTPTGQTPFPGPGAAGFNGATLTVAARNYDQGGQGVAYNDDPGLGRGAVNGGRTGSDVEQTKGGDIGWVKDGEWLEYTIDVAADGTYDLDMLLATTSGGRSVKVDFYQPGSGTPYATSGSVANASTGSFGNFQERSADGISLQAGTQIVRVTFAGKDQDFRSFTLTRAEDGSNAAPISTDLANVAGNEGTAFRLDAGAAFTDPDGDALTFTATGLPAGLSISPAGIITGTLPQVASSRDFAVTVTASDGTLAASESFSLRIADVPAPTGQTPFPGPGAAGFNGATLTVAARNYDQGGQGVAYNDDPGLGRGAVNGGRTGSDVEQTKGGDIGWVKDGEWLEYTIDVAADGIYDLDMLLATTSGGRSVKVDFYQPGSGTPYATSGSVANASTGSFGNFQERSADGISLQAGTQIVRVTFAGKDQDFRSFTLTRAEDAPLGNPQPRSLVGDDATGQSNLVSVAQTSLDPSFTMAFDQAEKTIGFGSVFSSVDDFVFLADMQTESGFDTADLGLTGFRTGITSIFVEEERSGDAEIRYVNDTIGFVAIEPGLNFTNDLLS